MGKIISIVTMIMLAQCVGATSVERNNLDKALPQGKLIHTLLKSAKSAKTKTQKQFYLTAASEQHSGRASLELAESLKEKNPEQAIQYYSKASRYGYAHEGYTEIAKIYEDGAIGIKKDELLASCFRNNAKGRSNQSLIAMCRNKYPVKFVVEPNIGLQSADEVIDKGKADFKAFCHNPNTANLLNPNLDKYEQTILANMICNPKDDDKTTLKDGDVVLKGLNLYIYSASGYLPYNKPVVDGLVVYRFNAPISLYIYKDKKLQPTQDGDQVIKDGKTYVVKNNQLVKFQ